MSASTRTVTIGAFVFALALLASPAIAQRVLVPKDLIADVADEVVMQPVEPLREITLKDLVQAKFVADDEPKLILMLEAVRTEKRMETVTRTEQQTRTRKVPDEDGKLVDQEFMITVEITENKEVDVKVPAGRKPTEFAASDFRFYDLAGKQVELEQAAQQLNQLRPMFLLDATHEAAPQVPDLFRQALRHDCLIGVTAKEIRQQPRTLPRLRWLPADIPPAIPAEKPVKP